MWASAKQAIKPELQADVSAERQREFSVKISAGDPGGPRVRYSLETGEVQLLWCKSAGVVGMVPFEVH